MSAQGLLQLAVLVVALAATAPPLGRHLAKVYASAEGSGPAPAPGDRLALPVERLLYRVCGVDDRREQRWTTYALSLLAFSVVGFLLAYAVLRLQALLPLNPTDRAAVPEFGAANAAISFVTNTNWQWFSPEQTVSHLTQMVAFTVQNFVSAAAGMAVAAAVTRGIARRRGRTLGNFWVDVTRSVTRVLLPVSFVGALVIAGLGVSQNLAGDRAATTVDRSVTATVVGADGTEATEQVTTQAVPGGPAASQVAIRNLGTNGGGFYNANGAHPLENPNGWTNLVANWMMLVVPFAMAFMFGHMVGRPRQGRVLAAVMAGLLLVVVLATTFAETGGNPEVVARGADQAQTTDSPGGNLEGKEVRFGPATCATYAASTTGTSTGTVNCMHDSLTPAGGALPMFQMMLGEVSPGGVGVGLMGILVNALLAVFIAGLMVGRTPELLGKKVQALEMKLVVLYIVAMPAAVLVVAALSVVLPGPVSSISNPGPHGLSQVLYNVASAGNNNGSAFAGMGTATDWYTLTQGLAMLVGRFLLIIPALAVAGSMVRKRVAPATSGTFPTDGPLFAGLLTGVVLIVGGLTFFPALALGPIVEQLSLTAG